MDLMLSCCERPRSSCAVCKEPTHDLRDRVGLDRTRTPQIGTNSRSLGNWARLLLLPSE